MEQRITGTWYCYLALCADKSLYCGVTVNLKRRMQRHNKGQGAKYTRSRRPVELFCARVFPDKCSAMRAEARVKRVPAGKKPEVLHELALNAWKQHTAYSGV